MQFNTHGARVLDSDLIVPVRDGDKLHSIQFISPDGGKKFLFGGSIRGCYYGIGKPCDVLLIAEGFATGASLHEATGHAVAVAFNAGNLLPVAKSLKEKMPHVQIIICADNDTKTEGNPGVSKAQEAADAVGGSVAVPAAHGDFNDLALAQGPEAVSEIIAVKIDNNQFGLDKFVLNGKSKKMREELTNETYFLGEMALMGQSTVFYAPPNTGKTLITLSLLIEAVRQGRVMGSDIYYINADDDLRGLTSKLEYAEKYGFWMLAPGFEGFEAKDLLKIIDKMNRTDTAKGKVLILDTLKSFSDLMDKKYQANVFNPMIKLFVIKGGTFVALSHTNKNRRDGKLVAGGTSDVVDDMNCVYILDTVNDDGNIKTIEFLNTKKRGSSAKRALYTYSSDAKSYDELLKSVKAVDEMDAEKTRREVAINTRLEINADIIETITECIKEGITNKTELIKEAKKRSCESQGKVIKVLKEHSGKYHNRGHRWFEAKGVKAAKTYQLTLPYSRNEYLAASKGG
ncbi:MAG: toprim domain-containing protein [Opitutaceae bacterium]|nr:toprim domain-containing protein [Opitutaceae bacterium]